MKEHTENYESVDRPSLVVQEPKPLDVTELKAHVSKIQEVMRSVMKKDVHYGVIPGCQKPSLLKPGAEILNLTFKFVPDPDVEVINLPNEHREYRVKVKIYSFSGIYFGAGVGSCSTMEGKYRYRAAIEATQRPVPKEYWNTKKSDPKKALSLIGGAGHTVKKVEGQWFIATMSGEKVPHDNPADFYNTCEKMGKKRALVDAILTITAASDVFTQDVEDSTKETEDQPEPVPEQVAVPNGTLPRPTTDTPASKQGTLDDVLQLKAKIEGALVQLAEKTGKQWQDLLKEYSRQVKGKKTYEAGTIEEIMQRNNVGEPAWARETLKKLEAALA